MRAVALAKVAAEAEALRLRLLAKRQVMRAAFGAGAAVFAIAVLVGIHVLIWNALQPSLSPVMASLVVLAIDLVAAVVLGVLAMRNTPSNAEQEALDIRRQAVVETRQALTFMSMVASITGVAIRTGTRRGMREGVTSALVHGVGRIIRR